MRSLAKIGFAFLVASTLCLSLTVRPASAATINYNNIIDDAVFDDSGSMSAAQIDAFLNGFPNSCISSNNGFSSALPTGYSPAGSTSPGYHFGSNVSAGTVIATAAQIYDINPQVLLATLQKEQSLVSGSAGCYPNTPNPTVTYSCALYGGTTMYNCTHACPYGGGCMPIAVGYGCPGACNAAQEGFSNQIIRAAWRLSFDRHRSEGQVNWYINKPGWDNSDDAQNCYNGPMTQGTLSRGPSTCGSGYFDGYYTTNDPATVHIDNGATAALYHYTPFEHGQSLFYANFTNWFGPTTGYLVRINETGKVYLLADNNTYYYVVSGQQLSALGYGSTLQTMLFANSTFLQNMTNGGDLPSAIRFGTDSNVYAFDGGIKHYYSYDAYTAYGQPAIGQMLPSLANIMPDGQPMATIIKQSDRPEIYYEQNAKARYIGGPGIYSSGGYSSMPSVTLSSNFVSMLAPGGPILQSGTYTKTSDTGIFGVVTADGALSQQKVSPTTASNISILPFTAPANTLGQLQYNDPEITQLAKDSSGNLFLIDGTNKINLSSSQLDSLNKTAADFTLANNDFLAKFKTISTGSGPLLFRIDNGTRVYELNNGHMIWIQTGDDFSRAGFNFNDVVNIGNGTAQSLFIDNGESLLLNGTLFRVGNNATVYLMGNDGKEHVIPSGDIFSQFGFSYGSVRSVTQATASNYATGQNLGLTVTAPDASGWAISDTTRHWISPSLGADYGVSSGVNATSSVLNPLALSSNMTHFIRVNNLPQVYYVSSGVKHPVSSPSSFASLGGTDWSQVISISQPFADSLPTSTTL